MFGEGTDGATAPSAPSPTPTAAEPQPGPPQATPPAAPTEVAGAAKPATEVGAPATEAAAQAKPGQSTPPAAEAAALDPYDPGALSQHLTQFEAQATQFVADQMFKLSPEETEALDQDITAAIPKLMAKVFVKSQQNVLQQMGRLIPMMMQRHLAAVKRNTSNEDKFYARWPEIKADVHGESVKKFASVYRQVHPQATLDQMIEDLGPMVMMANRIAPTPVAPTAAKTPMAPVAANGRAPQPSPFVPAGAGPTSAPKAAEMEAWEAMFRQE